MNKQEICKMLEKLGWDKEEYFILSGASLVIRNIKEETKDIDLCVSVELFETIKCNYNIEKINDSKHNNLYRLDEKIDFFVDTKTNFNREFVNEYPLVSLQSVLDTKRQRNLDKDLDDIKKIEKYLEEKDDLKK